MLSSSWVIAERLVGGGWIEPVSRCSFAEMMFVSVVEGASHARK